MDPETPRGGGASDRATAWPSQCATDTEPGDAQAAGDFRHAFQVGAHWFLIPPGMPGEVYPPLPCARLPFTQAWCLGLASFRGDLAPVYDLGALVDERTARPGRYFLLLGYRDACAALCIDAITGFAVAPDTAPGPGSSLPEPLSSLARGTLDLGGTDYHDLDLPGLLGRLAEQAGLNRSQVSLRHVAGTSQAHP